MEYIADTFHIKKKEPNLVAYKGKEIYDVSYVYAPYVPLQVITNAEGWDAEGWAMYLGKHGLGYTVNIRNVEFNNQPR